jgi:ribA/ribD-fused uncharacterized protein
LKSLAPSRRIPEFALLILVLIAVTCGIALSQSTQPATTQASPDKIAEFQGEYRFLSNFWPAEIVYEGITYPTAEHAYQAAKTLDVEQRKKIAALPTPAEAKTAGRALKLRDDWETAKFTVMEEVVRYKFTHHPELGAKLLATGGHLLEEGNTWGDRVWGVYQGQGENRLGKILMKVRDELRSSKPKA